VISSEGLALARKRPSLRVRLFTDGRPRRLHQPAGTTRLAHPADGAGYRRRADRLVPRCAARASCLGADRPSRRRGVNFGEKLLAASGVRGRPQSVGGYGGIHIGLRDCTNDCEPQSAEAKQGGGAAHRFTLNCAMLALGCAAPIFQSAVCGWWPEDATIRTGLGPPRCHGVVRAVRTPAYVASSVA
jgi:hypothetical protein